MKYLDDGTVANGALMHLVMGYLFDTGSSFMYKLAITLDLVIPLVPINYLCGETEISWDERTRNLAMKTKELHLVSPDIRSISIGDKFFRSSAPERNEPHPGKSSPTSYP